MRIGFSWQLRSPNGFEQLPVDKIQIQRCSETITIYALEPVQGLIALFNELKTVYLEANQSIAIELSKLVDLRLFNPDFEFRMVRRNNESYQVRYIKDESFILTEGQSTTDKIYQGSGHLGKVPVHVRQYLVYDESYGLMVEDMRYLKLGDEVNDEIR